MSHATRVFFAGQQRRRRIGRRIAVDGIGAAPVALETLAPLSVSQRTSATVSDDAGGGRMVIDFILQPAGKEEIVLAEFRTPPQARGRLQALASDWSLPSKYLWGGVIAPGDIGRPLHERLADDPDARRRVPLDPAWGLTITSQPSSRCRASRGAASPRARTPRGSRAT